MKNINFGVIIMIAFMLSSCAMDTKQKKGTVIGATLGTVVGAGVGYAIGGKKGAAIGAGSGLLVGGLAGNQIGKYMDNQEKELQQALAYAEAASIQREQDVLTVTFKSDFMFDIDSAIVKQGAYDEIDRVAQILIKYPQTSISIEGHTDSTGSEDYNLGLSNKRALAVKDALVDRNVDPARLQIIGFGEAKPVAGNDTEAGRQMNRRVKVVIIPVKA
jgi:outer membrane protein OmpA-like peptidoglycan-associated protein